MSDYFDIKNCITTEPFNIHISYRGAGRSGNMSTILREDKYPIMDNRYVEVYFKDETHDLKLKAEHVYSVEIEDGFLKIFDSYDKILHCFNISNVSHFHVPDEVFGHNL